MASSARGGTRRSMRLRTSLEKSGFAAQVATDVDDRCGACLLDIDEPDANGDFLGILDCCRPRHNFHAACILTWAAQENSCPQCKRRFSSIGIYDCHGCLVRTTTVEERDQDFEEGSDENAREERSSRPGDPDWEQQEEDSVCKACGAATDEAAMLLCDGQGGRCNAAYHYFCVGLSHVPDGDWFCPDCSDFRTNLATAAAQGTGLPKSRTVATVKQEKAEGSSSTVQVKIEPSLEGPASVLFDEAVESRSAASKAKAAAKGKAKGKAKAKAKGRAKAEASQAEEGRAPTAATATTAPTAATTAFSKPLHAPAAATPKKAAKKKSSSKSATTPASTPDGSSGKSRRRGSSSATAATVVAIDDAEPAVPASIAFRGLCHELPKWISRQGSSLRFDLGGRGFRDAAAPILGKVVSGALAYVGAGSAFTASVYLAGNKFKKAGLQAILEPILAAGLHVSFLDVERNRLGPTCSKYLAEWCSRQPLGPPAELLLSKNRIGEEAMLQLLLKLGRHPRKAKPPLWLELRSTGLKDFDGLLDRLSEEVEVCLALDRDVCGKCCCGNSSTEAGGRTVKLHLDGITKQGGQDEPLFGSLRVPLTKGPVVTDIVPIDDDEYEEVVKVEEEEQPQEPQIKSKAKSEEPNLMLGHSGIVGARMEACPPPLAQLAPSSTDAHLDDRDLFGTDSEDELQGNRNNGNGNGNINTQNRGNNGGSSSSSNNNGNNTGNGNGNSSRNNHGSAGGSVPAPPPSPGSGSFYQDAGAEEEEATPLSAAVDRRRWASTLGLQGRRGLAPDTGPLLSEERVIPASKGMWDLVEKKGPIKRLLSDGSDRAAKKPHVGGSGASRQGAKPAEDPHAQHRVVQELQRREQERLRQLEMERQERQNQLRLQEEERQAKEQASHRPLPLLEPDSQPTPGPPSQPQISNPWANCARVAVRSRTDESTRSSKQSSSHGARGDKGKRSSHKHHQSPVVGSVPDSLRRFVARRLHTWPQLWLGEEAAHRDLHRRCFRDQICKKALQEHRSFAENFPTWDAALRNEKFTELILSFVDEQAERQLARRRGWTSSSGSGPGEVVAVR